MLFRKRPPADDRARDTGRNDSSAPKGSRSGRTGTRVRDEFAEQALSHIDALYGGALRLTGRAVDAEDLVQDTYLKAFRFQHRFEPGTNLKAWLFTILHNTWRNARRASIRDPISVDSEAVERAANAADASDSPEARLSRQSLDADLRAALDTLPEAFRQAVWLRDVEDFSYAEIANMLGVPIGTVMSRISRGRRLLHERLTGAGRPALKMVGRSA
jgi:RNA polymerase sigma-70 factor, ECF subfamily